MVQLTPGKALYIYYQMQLQLQQIAKVLQHASGTVEQWKTTIDLPCMNLIIFPVSAVCPSSLIQAQFSTVQLACCKTLQSAVLSCGRQLHTCANNPCESLQQ